MTLLSTLQMKLSQEFFYMIPTDLEIHGKPGKIKSLEKARELFCLSKK